MSDQHELISLTADIVSAMVSNNKVGIGDVPALIQSTYAALENAGAPAPAPEAKQEPAVSIRASVKNDYIVCLEDGKKLKMLKRYLRTNYNMSAEDYRAKWGLPRDYPMVAPAYAETRKELAKKIGLGRRKAEEVVEAVKKAPAKAAKSVTDSISKAREHLGGDAPAKAPAKRGRKPAAKPAEAVEG